MRNGVRVEEWDLESFTRGKLSRAYFGHNDRFQGSTGLTLQQVRLEPCHIWEGEGGLIIGALGQLA